MDFRKLKGLMWREVFLWKRYIAINTAIITVLVVFAFLLTGSMYYGNLSKITGAGVDELFAAISMCILLYPSIQMMAYIMSIVESTTVRDELVSWKRFRKTTPIKPIEFATARYFVNILIYLGGLLLAISYAFIYCAVFHTEFTFALFATIIAFSAGILIMSVIVQMLVMLLHSMEKAMIFFTFVFLGGFSVYIFSTADEVASTPTASVQETILMVEEKCLNVLPWVAIIIPVTFLLGFAGMTFLLGRREK